MMTDKRVGLQLSDTLFGLGLDLMEQARSATTPRRGATLDRDGLIIAFAALVPLRRKNLAQLRIGVSLTKVGPTWRAPRAGLARKGLMAETAGRRRRRG
jgi:hypothetical protein